nr:MAG: ubiquinone biosynthesis protein [Bacteriophage sp.]
MKGLQFLGNRVEDAAMSFINVLKYSDQSVDYPSFENLEEWPDEILDLFKAAARNNPHSELTAVIQYSQQAVQFDEISELMLGIALVEMQHSDKINNKEWYYTCSDASIVEAFLEKLIADEQHHVKLLREALGTESQTKSKGVTVIIR